METSSGWGGGKDEGPAGVQEGTGLKYGAAKRAMGGYWEKPALEKGGGFGGRETVGLEGRTKKLKSTSPNGGPRDAKAGKKRLIITGVRRRKTWATEIAIGKGETRVP